MKVPLPQLGRAIERCRHEERPGAAASAHERCYREGVLRARVHVRRPSPPRLAAAAGEDFRVQHVRQVPARHRGVFAAREQQRAVVAEGQCGDGLVCR